MSQPSSPDSQKHPRGLYVLFFTEMFERFGFYTMSALLYLFVKAPASQGGLGLSQKRALGFWGYYSGSVYFTPLLGGLAADLLLGERLAITIGAVLLATGYFMLSLPPDKGLTLFYGSLAAIALGNGLFKPNISTIVGKLYPAGSPLQDAGFNVFYTGINLGALVAPFAASFIRKAHSWQAAFAVAGAGMVVSLAVFTALRRHYTGDNLVKERASAQADAAGPEAPAPPAPVGMGSRLAALMVLYVVSTMFWTLFFQNGAALTSFAEDCTRRPAWLGPEVFQAVNPFCIVVFSLVAARVWRRLGERGLEPAIPDKILLGLGAAVLACGVMFYASLSGGDRCLAGGAGEQVSALWLVGTYVMVSVAEILVSPMGLSYCTKVAPGKAGGLVMGGWFVSLSAGGLLSGEVGRAYWAELPHSTYFVMLAVGTAAVALLLFAVRGLLRRAVPA